MNIETSHGHGLRQFLSKKKKKGIMTVIDGSYILFVVHFSDVFIFWEHILYFFSDGLLVVFMFS